MLLSWVCAVLLTVLMAFNALSMITLHRERKVIHMASGVTLFVYALLASELAWFWLPMQLLLSALLVWGGALFVWLGKVALVALLVSWFPLLVSVYTSFDARRQAEVALKTTLGDDYAQQIPEAQRRLLEYRAPFREWVLPARMRRSAVEKISHVPYGPHGIMNRLDIYRPKTLPEGGCPVLLQIHGGAWMVGSKTEQALPLMHYMASKGWICCSVNYRLSPSVAFPTQVEDCKRALQWIRSEGHKYGMNADFVAVTGGSAGGHLTAMLALTQNWPQLQREIPDADTRVQAAVPLYGVYDFLCDNDLEYREMFTKMVKNRVIHGSPETVPELWELASPIRHVSGKAPPMMVIHGDYDSLATISGARRFRDRLRETSVNPAVYVELDGAEHSFDTIHSPRTDTVIRAIHRFLEWSRFNCPTGDCPADCCDSE